VTVTRIDRRARSTFDLFVIVKQIVDAKAQFRSLAEPWADTGTSTGRLMLAVLGGLADVERNMIRTRTAEARTRAKARGQPMGRPPSLNTGTAERGHQTARYVTGIGRQLRPQHIHHAPRHQSRLFNDFDAKTAAPQSATNGHGIGGKKPATIPIARQRL
jgi:DNA invertase Pin-like site-specific DNA recombinase